MLTCTAAGSGWGNEDSFKNWERLFRSSFTDEERAYLDEQERIAEEEELRKQRAARAKAMAKGKGTTILAGK